MNEVEWGPEDPEEVLRETFEDLDPMLMPLAKKAKKEDIVRRRENQELYLRLKGFYEMAKDIREGMSVEDAFEKMYATHETWHKILLVPSSIPELEDEEEEDTEKFYDKETLRRIFIGEHSDINMPPLSEEDQGKGLWALRKKFMQMPPLSKKKYKLWIDKGLTRPFLFTGKNKKQVHVGFNSLTKAIQAQRAIKKREGVEVYINGISHKPYTFWRDSKKLKPLFFMKKRTKYQLDANSAIEAIALAKKLTRKNISFYISGLSEQEYRTEGSEEESTFEPKKYYLWLDAQGTQPYFYTTSDGNTIHIGTNDFDKALKLQQLVQKQKNVMTYIK